MTASSPMILPLYAQQPQRRKGHTAVAVLCFFLQTNETEFLLKKKYDGGERPVLPILSTLAGVFWTITMILPKIQSFTVQKLVLQLASK